MDYHLQDAGHVQPKWFTPQRMLIIFCAINLLNYLDRGVIASNGVNGAPGNYSCRVEEACVHGSGIQGDFRLTYFEDGMLSSAFMVGLLVSSPIFAELSRLHNPFRLIAIGQSVWTVATLGCGFSIGFWSITFFRMLTGIGEASFVSLAAPFIDDNAPPNKKGVWLSIFYMCIPVGVAFGYVFGGLVGGLLHWRAAFLLEALLMLPFAVFGFISGSVSLRGEGTSPNPDKQGEVAVNRLLKAGVLNDVKGLFQNRLYNINLLGYVVFNFVLGAYSYWGPKAGQSIYNVANTDTLFGVITILSGITGTIFGGLWLDYLGPTIKNGFKVLAISTFMGAVTCLVAFLSRNVVIFFLVFAVGEFFIFATQGPVNCLTLQCVLPESRALSMAMSTVLIHIFGDVPSSPLVGALQDYMQNWRSSALILTSILIIAAAIWGSGIVVAPIEDPRIGISSTSKTEDTEEVQNAPLLS